MLGAPTVSSVVTIGLPSSRFVCFFFFFTLIVSHFVYFVNVYFSEVPPVSESEAALTIAYCCFFFHAEGESFIRCLKILVKLLTSS